MRRAANLVPALALIMSGCTAFRRYDFKLASVKLPFAQAM